MGWDEIIMRMRRVKKRSGFSFRFVYILSFSRKMGEVNIGYWEGEISEEEGELEERVVLEDGRRNRFKEERVIY